MKKLYLLAAAALLGGNFASAQTLTQVWQKHYLDYAFDSWNVGTINWDDPQNITGGNGSRIGIGMNGKVYTLNTKTMYIMEMSEEGMKDAYKLPSLKGRTFKYNEMAEAFTEKTRDDYYGVFVTRDDAGHFLIGHGFTTNAVPYLWTVYDPATDKAKHFEVSFPVVAGAEAQYSMLRIDHIGRAMGNVLQDGGIAIAPVAHTWPTIKDKYTWAKKENVARIKFINFYSETENNTDVDNVDAEGEYSEWVYLGSPSGNVCQSLYNSLDEFNAAVKEKGSAMQAIKDGTYLFSRDGVSLLENEWALVMGAYDGSNSVVNSIGDRKELAKTAFGQNSSPFTTFDTFVLQGERYYVTSYMKDKVMYGDKVNKNVSFAVFNSKGEVVAYQDIAWNSHNGWSTISVEPIDETSVNVYLFAEAAGTTIPGVMETAGNYGIAGQYKFSVPKTSGIEDIAVDQTETAPVYYNLQGVEIANPENGIYIVRRGNKVAKEVIR